MGQIILLTRGKVATVSDEDYDFLTQWSWVYATCGYAVRSEGSGQSKRSYLMHREILTNIRGNIDNFIVDHIDKNGLNNTRDNIRLADKVINAINSKVPSDNTSGCKGVSLVKSTNSWRAYISIYRKQINLGCFKNFEDAVAARLEAEKKYFYGYIEDFSSEVM